VSMVMMRHARKVGSHGTIELYSSKGLQQIPCTKKICIGFIYLIHGFVGRAATAATISWKFTRQLQRKQQVIETLRLAKEALKHAARRQTLRFTKHMTFSHSLCQNSCRLRCCRLLCVAVASISGRCVSKSASRDS